MVQSHHGQIYDVLIAGFEQAFHSRVHMCAVCRHRFDAGPTENATGRTRMTRPDRLIVGIEDEAERLVEYAITPSVGTRMNVSKNHVVCARCHLVGLASGMDWTVWSSAESGAARAS